MQYVWLTCTDCIGEPLTSITPGDYAVLAAAGLGGGVTHTIRYVLLFVAVLYLIVNHRSM